MSGPGKRCHARFFRLSAKHVTCFCPQCAAKGVAHIPRQEVTLLYTLYRIPLSLAILSRKEVLTVSIDASLESRDAREQGKFQAVKIALLFTAHRNRWSSVHLLTFQGIRQNQQDLFIAVYLTERALRQMVQWESRVTGSGRLRLALPRARSSLPRGHGGGGGIRATGYPGHHLRQHGYELRRAHRCTLSGIHLPAAP